MLYLSTRGHPERKRFCQILLEGLAPDGGLYLPEAYPQVDATTLARWRVALKERLDTCWDMGSPSFPATTLGL